MRTLTLRRLTVVAWGSMAVFALLGPLAAFADTYDPAGGGMNTNQTQTVRSTANVTKIVSPVERSPSGGWIGIDPEQEAAKAMLANALILGAVNLDDPILKKAIADLIPSLKNNIDAIAKAVADGGAASRQGYFNNLKGALNELETATRNGWILESKNFEAIDGTKLIMKANGELELLIGQFKTGYHEVDSIDDVINLINKIQSKAFNPDGITLNKPYLDKLLQRYPELKGIDWSKVKITPTIEVPDDVLANLGLNKGGTIDDLINAGKLRGSGLWDSELAKRTQEAVKSLEGYGTELKSVQGQAMSKLQQAAREEAALQKLIQEAQLVKAVETVGQEASLLSRGINAAKNVIGGISKLAAPITKTVAPILPAVAGILSVGGLIIGGMQLLKEGERSAGVVNEQGWGALVTTQEGRSAALRTFAGSAFTVSGAAGIAALATSWAGITIPILGTAALVAGAVGLVAEGLAIVNDHWDGIVSTVKNAAKSAGQAISNAVKSTAAAITSGVQQAAKSVTTAVKSFANLTINTVKSAASTVASAAKTVATTVATAAKSVAGSVAGSVASAAKSAAATVASVASSAASAVRSAASAATSAVKSAVSSVASAAKSAVSSAVSSAKSAVSNIASSIGSFFSGGSKPATASANASRASAPAPSRSSAPAPSRSSSSGGSRGGRR